MLIKAIKILVKSALDKRSLFLSFFYILLNINGFSQFVSPTPVQDGTINNGEYGIHVDGQNQQESAGGIWFLTWDANNLYLAIQGSAPWDGGVVYLDVNPVIPVNGGTDSDGSLNWSNDYDRTRLVQPIRSDFKFYFKDSYNEYRYSNGSNDWSSPVTNVITSAANYVTNSIEIIIPWNTITNGNGRPTSFNWFGYKMYDNGDDDNGTYHPVPDWNPIFPNNASAGEINDIYVPFYYSVINTDNNTATKPFLARSFTYHEDSSAQFSGGYQLGGYTLYDLTVNDNSEDNSDNSPGFDFYNNAQIANRVLINDDITINNNLYVGLGSALFPADNSSGAVDVTITMDGSSGEIYNFGRIDCTPEVSQNSGDWDLRRLNFVFDGTTEIKSTSISRDRYRFSNITLNNGAELISDGLGSAEIQLQFGTLNNNGTINFSTIPSSTVSIGLRGENVFHNDYFFESSSGSGTFIFHDLLIGRYSSKLQPSADAGSMLIQVKGNFENYSDFSATNGSGIFSIMMNGTGRQEIKGDAAETLNDKTVFRNLTIANDNGNNDDNSSADVHFVSNSATTIDYYVTGVFNMSAGDLVTRDRLDPSIVHKLFLDDGVFAVGPGAQSFSGANNSCFIDGPVSFVLVNRPSITLEFLVGKDASFRRILFTAFSSATTDPVIYTGEVFHESAYTLNNTIPTSPELIDNISLVHYWNVEVNDPSYFNSGFIWLDYDQIASDDGVTDPSNLRILKAPTGGNSAWENISVGAGGVGVGTGSILSNQFFSLSDFTLGNIGSNPLPVELISFSAEPKENSVQLNWQTASEIDNDYFQIWRSKDAVNFEEITRVNGAGNSNQLLSYSVEDSNPFSGWNYYKLTQVDFDGTTWESDLKSVFFEPDNDVQIYPNPTAEFINVKHNGEVKSYSILDINGHVLVKNNFENDQLEQKIDLSSFSPGTYIFQVIYSNDSTNSYKIMRF